MELEITFALLLFFGILLTAIPTVPGMLFMLAITIVYGIIDKFETMQPWHFAIFGGLVLLAIATDYLSGLIGAKFGGANKKSLLIGIGGMVIGFIVFPPFGLFVGLFIGVFIAELMQFQNHTKAFKAASYSFLATILGIGFNIVLAIAFLVSFLIIVF